MKVKKLSKKLSLNKETVSTLNRSDLNKFLAGADFTGNCGSFIHVTCPDPNCDFQSIPLNECFGGGDTNPGFQEPAPTFSPEDIDCYPGDGLAPA